MCEASLLCGKNAEARKFSAEEKHLVLCGGGDYFHGHKKAFDQATVQSDKQNYFMARRLKEKNEDKILVHGLRRRAFDDEALTEFDRAWMDEAEKRYRELMDGKVVGIPAEEVFASIRAELKCRS